MKYWILTLTITLMAQSAFADGTETGNGGDALVCYDANDNIESVRLLDFYEAIEKKRIKKIELGESKGKKTYDQKVHYALDRLAKLNPTRANKYRKWYSTFFSDEEFKWGGKLPNIPDTGSLDYPENCEVEQIAIHEKPELPGDKRYIIRRKLWDYLSPDHKAGLVLHELVYREAKEQKIVYNDSEYDESTSVITFHSNSKKVRHFTSTISSHKFNSMPLQQYIALAQTVRFQIIDINELPVISFWVGLDKNNPGKIKVKFPKINFYNANVVKSHKLSDFYYGDAFLRHSDIGCTQTTYAGYTGCISQYKEISFFKNGNLKSGFYILDKSEKVKITKYVLGLMSESDRSKSRSVYFQFFFNSEKVLVRAKLNSWHHRSRPDQSSRFLIKIPNYASEVYTFYLHSTEELHLNRTGYVTQVHNRTLFVKAEHLEYDPYLSSPKFDSDGNLLSVRAGRYEEDSRHKLHTAVYVQKNRRPLDNKAFRVSTKGKRNKVLKKAVGNAKSQCQDHINSTVPEEHQNAFQCTVNEDHCYSTGWLSKKTHCTARIKIVSTESEE